MLKKINIIFFILFLIISGYLLLELEGSLVLLDLATNKLFLYIYILLSVIITFFMLFSVFKLNSVKSKVIEKIVYKEIEKQAENQVDTIEEKSEEEVIEKAMELSNKVLFELGDMDDIEKYCDKLLINISKNFNIVQGVFFVLDKSDNKFKTKGTYAFYSEEVFREFELGVGLTGQVAKNKRFLTINNVPEQYIKILSGLGSGSPGFLTLIPVINDDNTIGIIEIASFEKLSDDLEKLSMHLSLEIGSDIIRFF